MAVTISIEIELGWGVHDVGEYPHLSEDGDAERAALRRLLDRCDAVGVPISFDVVGHLFEADCGGDHDGPHRPGWFENDPGTDAARDPLFYAPELVREILDRPTDHEVCTHTYSHVLCGDADRETVAWELDRAQSIHRDVTGEETTSIVPPRHSRPPSPALREAGIEVMRMSRDTSDRGRASRLKELVVGPHPVFEPAFVDGVVETYCTSYPSLTSSTLPSGQQPPLGPFRALPVGLRQRLHRQYLSRALDAAAARDGDCHLWCHLYDLSNDAQWPGVSSFLGELATRRARGELAVRTMAKLNDAVRAEAQTRA
ncbi:polysaccharide deacetylase family protein [Halobacterium hubeiense]|uniref:polysaccharide deacetylase family protein n=1 Tax=Halobacterium hubeiense TaxID=1407499 RepID=UPI003C7700C7